MKFEGNAILRWTALFYFLFSVWALANFREAMSGNMLTLTYALSASFYLLVWIGTSMRSNKFIIFSAIFFSLFWGIQLREVYLIDIGNYFGEGIDIKYYEKITIANIDSSLGSFINVLFNDIGVDDWGFFSLLYMLYSAAGTVDGGRTLVVISNIIAISLSSIYFVNILRRFGTPSQIAFFLLSLLAFSPFNIVTFSVGLKENFFLCLIILTLYAMIRSSERRNIASFLLALGGIFLNFFFRPPVAVALLIVYFVAGVITEKNKSKLFYWAMILGGIMLPFIDAIFSMLFNRSLEEILYTTNYRLGQVGSAESGWAVNFIGALLGPFPNFTRSDRYGIYYSSFLLLKSVLGSFFYIGVYKAYRDKILRYIPLLLYWFLSVLLYVFAGVALDYRYHITVFPVWLLFVALGIKVYNEDKKERKIPVLYISVVLILIFIYNLRGEVLV